MMILNDAEYCFSPAVFKDGLKFAVVVKPNRVAKRRVRFDVFVNKLKVVAGMEYKKAMFRRILTGKTRMKQYAIAKYQQHMARSAAQ